MGYTALYRKWRPSGFEGVMGQQHIVQTLKNQIVADKVAHAYLFCGTRGTGKTTSAKIFGKAVNCESPIEGSPCNTCAVCQLINENRSMNIIEIDAASNNGVDNIREIREEVKYTPTDGKFKVYIIDEVHMLSTGAFNALLKTLEEPPSHVIFILATTEPHKIPATILSRCQRYDFKRIDIQTIADTLSYYMTEEKIEIEESAIRYIAKVADGSMRDALSILDQCIAFYLGQSITLDKVLDVLGAVDTQIFIDILKAIGEKDARACMEYVNRIIVQGRDISQFIMDLINHLRNILILKSVRDGGQILDMSKENMDAIKEQAQGLSEESVIYYIKIFSELEAKIKYASSKRILLEVELMKLCQPSMDDSAMGLLERIKDLEEKLEKGVQIVGVPGSAPPVEAKKKEIPKMKPLSRAVPEDIKKVIENWDQLVNGFSGVGKALIREAKPTFLDDGFLYIVCKDQVGVRFLSQENIKEEINGQLEAMGGKQFSLKIIDADEYQMVSGETSSGQSTQNASSSYEDITARVNLDVEIL